MVRAESSAESESGCDIALNKKQQKQIEAAKNKIQRLQQLLNAARKQPDDPQEIPALEKQIAQLNAEIEKIRAEG